MGDVHVTISTETVERAVKELRRLLAEDDSPFGGYEALLRSVTDVTNVLSNDFQLFSSFVLVVHYMGVLLLDEFQNQHPDVPRDEVRDILFKALSETVGPVKDAEIKAFRRPGMS